jgi:hypothetical protein
MKHDIDILEQRSQVEIDKVLLEVEAVRMVDEACRVSYLGGWGVGGRQSVNGGYIPATGQTSLREMRSNEAGGTGD